MEMLRDSLLKKLIKKSSQSIESFVENRQMEDLHKLRVAVKRIDVLLRILNYGVKDFHFKTHKKNFKEIFSAAGKIWGSDQMQINLLQLPFAESLRVCMDELQTIKERESIKFIALSKKFFEQLNSEKKKLEKFSDELTPDTVREYFVLRLQKLHFAKEPDDFAQMHLLRKEVKRMMYAHEFLKLLGAELLLSENEMKQFDTLQEAIGKWHDKEAMHDFLTQHTGAHENYLSALEQSLKQEMKNLFRDVKSGIDSLIFRLGLYE